MKNILLYIAMLALFGCSSSLHNTSPASKHEYELHLYKKGYLAFLENDFHSAINEFKKLQEIDTTFYCFSSYLLTGECYKMCNEADSGKIFYQQSLERISKRAFSAKADTSLPGIIKQIENWCNLYPEKPDSVLKEIEFVPYEKDPVVLTRVNPEYPIEQLKQDREGNVFVKVWIDTLGIVRDVQMLKADNQYFASSAIAAAYQWKFKPPMLGSHNISAWIAIPFRFRIR